MSDLEAMMWSLDADPHLSSTFANLTFFDRAPDHERLRARLWRASRLIPRLRQRVASSMGPFAPRWEDAPDFDIDRHIRRVELPVGSDESQARALAVQLARQPFDRTHPLWEFTVIEGLPDGRAAMVQKMHHSITDGKGGIRMSVEFIDMDRDAAAPPPVDDGPPSQGTTADDRPVEAVSPVSSAMGALGGLASTSVRTAQQGGRFVGSALELARSPGALATALSAVPGEVSATTRSLLRQYAVVEPSRSPLWTERSLDRSLEVFDVSLDEVKQATQRLGGSVNDLFVAAAAGGAGRYHRARGCDPDQLRMSMPVSTRTDRAPGGNAFTPTRVLVPTMADPVARFADIHQRLSITKTERSMGLMPAVASAAKLLPLPILIRIARQQVMTVDFTTSNVRAAPFDLYIAGALMERNYPLGPIAGTSWNLTTMSYRGLLNLGLHIDTAAVEEPAALAADIEDEFHALIEAGRPRRRSRRAT